MVDLVERIEKVDIETAGIMGWQWDSALNEIYYDAQWIKMLHYSLEDVLCKRSFWEDRIHPEDKIFVIDAFEKFSQGFSDSYKIEYRLLNKQGVFIPVLDVGTIIRKNNNEVPAKISVLTVDLTSRLRPICDSGEEKYKSIFEHLNDAFCRFDFSGEILDVNQNLCKLLEVSESELKKCNIKLFFNNRTIKFLYRDLAKILENEYVSFETNIVSNTAREIPVSINARLITVSGNGVVQALIRDITDRRVYEKALFEEKQRFQALVEHSPMVITRFGKNLRCQYASPNIYEMIGLKSDLCVGKRLLEMNFALSLSKYLEEKIKWIFKKNKVLKINFLLDLLEGVKHFDAILVPESSFNGIVDSVLITFSDITEKIVSERELNYSKQQLEEFEKRAHIGTYEIDLNTGGSKWSKEKYIICERDQEGPAPTMEEFFYHYLHPDDFLAVTESISNCILNVSNANLVYRIITSGGKVKYLNDMIRIEINRETGKPAKLIGTILDVTDKKLIENRLATEHDILQVIMDNVPDAIYLKDVQGQYIRANKAMSDLFLLASPEEMIGKTSYDFYAKEIADEITEMEQLIYATGLPEINKETEFILPSGKCWLSTTIVGVKDGSGKVTQVAGISRNINQYKLVQEQLQKAKEKAEVADRLKSAFLANMSHEIRTPINGILGFANLLEIREFSRDKEVRYLRIINNSGKLLLNLINDIIDIAKIEAGQITIENSTVNLNELMHEIYEFYIGEKKRREKEMIDIILDIPEDSKSLHIITDPFRLKQVVNNLIGNALKFTEKGNIRLGYKYEFDNVLFFVQDTGIGMSDEESVMVFERFKQAGISSRKKEGTGLGLAISRGLVELLGGKIWVTTKIEVGSSFYFSIPYNSVNSGETKLQYHPGISSVPEYNWHGKNILLVEDEEVNYTYINELLMNTGINLIHATTAEEAIEICNGCFPIDLILMDMRLPGINGFEATRLVKKIRKNVPVIAQTAYAMENERKDCLDAGCDHYLTKPFDQEGLFKVINNYI